MGRKKKDRFTIYIHLWFNHEIQFSPNTSNSSSLLFYRLIGWLQSRAYSFRGNEVPTKAWRIFTKPRTADIQFDQHTQNISIFLYRLNTFAIKSWIEAHGKILQHTQTHVILFLLRNVEIMAVLFHNCCEIVYPVFTFTTDSIRSFTCTQHCETQFKHFLPV